MASAHLHSIELKDKYLHNFNLQFMSEEEALVLNQMLNGKPIPQNKMEVLNSLKGLMADMIRNASNKNNMFPQIKAQRESEAEEVEAEVVSEE